MRPINLINKVVLLAFFTLNFTLLTVVAQNDTMFFMKDGIVIHKQSIKMEDLDSIIFYQPVIEEPTSGKFTDVRDGNVYNWIKIGEQVWMGENLKYLPSVVMKPTMSQTIPYYYVADYNGTNVPDAKVTANYSIYGVLYNWPAAMADAASSTGNPSGVEGVCPTGWHLPSDAEWQQLIDYIGDANNVGINLKAKELWSNNFEGSGDGNGTDDYSFSALPAGNYNVYGSYYISHGTYYWSSTMYDTNSAWIRCLFSHTHEVSRYNMEKDFGLSVRCVRD